MRYHLQVTARLLDASNAQFYLAFPRIALASVPLHLAQGCQGSPMHMTMHPFGRRRVFPKDSVLFPPGDATHHLHRIEEGVVRQCLYLSDGQRLVAGFAFPGELIGLVGGHQMLTIEAAAPVLTFEWAVDPQDEHDQRVSMLVLALHQAYLALALRSRRHARARVAAFL